MIIHGGVTRVSAKTDKNELLKRFGMAVRRYRETIRLSQEALADAAGIERSHMGRIERGERNVSLLNIAKIASSLGLTLEQLFTLVAPATEPSSENE